MIASTGIISGEHNDVFDVRSTIHQIFDDLKRNKLDDKGAIFNLDSSFDAKTVRKMLWNRGVIPNIDENKRNRKKVKRGRKRHFNRDVYKHRFGNERTFAWVDKFRTLVIRFERKDAYWMGFHCIAFALINLRGVLA